MSLALKKIKAGAAAFVISTALFTGLPLFTLFIRPPILAAAWENVLLPYYVFPALSFLSGLIACVCAGYIMDLPVLTAIGFLPSYFIFYAESACAFPVLRLSLIYAGACLMGLLLAFPAYCSKRLEI